ncbi:MAG: DUF421 domain-containing protein [Flavobacterium psychrophilum]|nr:MAG: DUF421 domain-containing protein [Flavobacterium psychrophilum]
MNFEWDTMFINELDLQLSVEIAIRTLIMFLLILTFLRLSGKKGVRQLSIFEVAIIIALGSAAGDPMISQDFAIVPSLLVFTVIIALYRGITYLAGRYEGFERLVEGDPVYVIEDGRFVLSGRNEHNFARDEFFAEMRNMGISHVGQIHTAILETNGKLSIYFYENERVRPGLPVLPKLYNKRSTAIGQKGLYACTYCGECSELSQPQECRRCGKEEWVKPLDNCRA